MVEIKSSQIKVLREKTGAGIMDCKTALLENAGDIEHAAIWLRKKGISSANKKSARTAAEGLVGVSLNNDLACILEVNSETDFVSKNKEFQAFINHILSISSKKKMQVHDLMKENYTDKLLVEDALKELIAKIGENIVIRRLSYLLLENDDCFFASYIHNKVDSNLGKIVSLIVVKEKHKQELSRELGKKLAMHISAMRPLSLNREQLDSDVINKEKDIIKAQLIESGKPDNMISKITEGKISRFISENTLLEQNWVMDTSIKVKDVINNFNKEKGVELKLVDFDFLVLGEGVEVVNKDFKQEVESQL